MRGAQLSLSLPGTGLAVESRALMKRLRADAKAIGLPFGLVPRTLRAERDDAAHYGICDSEGHILIRLRHARTGRVLRYSSLVNTLCHELAHLAHLNHGDGFKALFFRVLDFARREGLYRPATNALSPGCGLAAPRAHRAPLPPRREQLLLAMGIPGRLAPPQR